MNTPKYLGVAIAHNGNVFAHPADGSKESWAAHEAALARGDVPYTHLYEGDNVEEVLWKMEDARLDEDRFDRD